MSGGQTGVDRAALDVAIKLALPHGGWIPKGRITESGPLSDKYNLKETESSSYTERTEKNVMDADGTLIISRGPLTGGSEYTREMALKHDRSWLHIDLSQSAAFQAVTTINQWIMQKKIGILNVAGPRASKDPSIYREASNILESTYYLGLAESSRTGAGNLKDLLQSQTEPPVSAPRTVNEAIDRLISNMPLKDKTTVANMSQIELPNLHLTLGRYIMNNFGLLSGNQELLKSCRSAVKDVLRHEEDAVAIIIDALWKKLQQTHKLRIIK
ncbi:MAG: putative molybdenum carrier protein [Deltaproteobacteria bacterium]|nr:putative molybdenum carrier protein [Deltaproteobacteria bacterium]